MVPRRRRITGTAPAHWSRGSGIRKHSAGGRCARAIARADFTILGASGYVGSALVAALERAGHRVHAVTRGALPALLETRRNAGHVIDCIGLTGDFRTRPHDTAEAHVGVTARCLAALHFESFLFLSSTRVYARATATNESAVLACAPADPSDLYNLTKLAGEAVCLADPRQTVRVARLSNVYGGDMPDDTFLGQLLREGRGTGAVRFRQSAKSSKDYVSLARGHPTAAGDRTRRTPPALQPCCRRPTPATPPSPSCCAAASAGTSISPPVHRPCASHR